MKCTVLALGVTFTVSAKLHAVGVNFPNSDKKDTTQHNHFKVTVKTPLGRATFDFYMSHQDYINRVVEMDEAALKNAFNCFVSDSVSGNDTFENFCSEFGYDEDSRKAEKIYKACERSLVKLKRIYDGNVYDLANELNEQENAG